MTVNNKMRNKEIIKLIESNLNDFYTTIAETSGVNLFKGKDCFWIKNKSGFWPGFIYNTSLELLNSSQKVLKVVGEIKKKNAPPFWILRIDDKFTRIEKLFEEYNIRPVIQWTGMAVDLHSVKRDTYYSGDVECIAVSNPDQLKLWIDIVNSVLFNSEKLDYVMFKSLFKNPVFKFFLGYYNGQAVATSMRFLSAKTAGFYFITTLPEFRNKGFGHKNTIVLINDSVENGYDTGVLHATAKAESIYKKIGFKDYCKINIYWMLGEY